MKSASLSRALWVYHYPAADCGGCRMELECINRALCELSIPAAETVRNIRRADCLIITGAINYEHISRLKLLYSQAPRPVFVIAMGVCAIDGGIFRGSYNLPSSAERHMPVDIYIPGCPPRPEAVKDGVIKLLSKIKNSYKKKQRKRK